MQDTNTPTCFRVDVFRKLLLLRTTDSVLPRLQFQHGARLTETLLPKSIHSSLQSAVFPAKEVVTVRSVTRATKTY